MNHDLYGPPPSGLPDPLAPPPPRLEAPAPPTGFAVPPPPPAPAGSVATTGRNWMGIVSIVLAALGGGLAGTVLGFMGHAAAKRGEATNGKLALWGGILNLAIPVLIFGSFAVIGIVTEATAGDRVEPQHLAVGECIARPSVGDDDVLASRTVERLPCDEEHWGQMYSRGQLDNSPYPADDVLLTAVTAICEDPIALAHIDERVPTDAVVFMFYPSADTWREGQRGVQCVFIRDSEEDFTGDYVTP